MVALDALMHGLNLPDIGLLINRVAVGVFFTLSGFHKLFNEKRHAQLVETLENRRIPFLGFNQWFVPTVEFLGGLAAISGLLAPLAALGMLTILMVAIVTDLRERVADYSPIDAADYLCDVLYLPEVIYLIPLLILVFAGSGAYSFASLFS